MHMLCIVLFLRTCFMGYRHMYIILLCGLHAICLHVVKHLLACHEWIMIFGRV